MSWPQDVGEWGGPGSAGRHSGQLWAALGPLGSPGGSWRPRGPNVITRVLIRGRLEGQRQRGGVAVEAEVERMGHGPRNVGDPRSLKRQGSGLSLSLQKERGPASPLWTSDPRAVGQETHVALSLLPSPRGHRRRIKEGPARTGSRRGRAGPAPQGCGHVASCLSPGFSSEVGSAGCLALLRAAAGCRGSRASW